MKGDRFSFKRFTVVQSDCGMKVGTDGVLIGAWAQGAPRILDVGTGTGLMALMMAQRFAEAQVWGIDVDTAACRQAAENFAASPFSDRLHIVENSLQNFCRTWDGEAFGSIVCNPPFFVDSLVCKDERRTIARHDKNLSFNDLFSCSKPLLKADGRLTVIVPSEVLSMITASAAFAGFSLVARCDIRTVARKQPRRHLLSFSLNPTADLVFEDRLLQEADGSRSKWYSQLMADFYL